MHLLLVPLPAPDRNAEHIGCEDEAGAGAVRARERERDARQRGVKMRSEEIHPNRRVYVDVRI
jgi:hypothetical protein